MPGSWWCIRSCMDTSASPRMNSDSRRQTNASGRTTPRSWTTSPATLVTLLSSRSHLQWRPFLSGTSYLQALQRLTLCYHARVSWRIRLISLAPPSAYYSPWRSADYPPRTRTRKLRSLLICWSGLFHKLLMCSSQHYSVKIRICIVSVAKPCVGDPFGLCSHRFEPYRQRQL